MKTRLEVLDVLRGFAILGTLGTNILLFANAGNLGALFGQNPYSTQLEYALQQITLTFTNGKFLGMLTIMFGIGLELHYQSAKKRGAAFLPAYLWRSTILLLDGFVHFVLVIEFDILMGYALTAMIVAWVVTRGERVMRAVMWSALAVHALLVGLGTLAIASIDLENSSALGDFEGISRVYLNGTYPEAIIYRLQNFLTLRLEPIFVIPMGIALFLFGVSLLRSNALSDPIQQRRMMIWGLGLGLPLNALALMPISGLELVTRYLSAPILSVGYIGLIAYAFGRGWLEGVKKHLATFGRMALSNYVLQGVLASILFYGWGFGLARHPNAYIALVAWLGIGATLMVFSNLWLRKFALGPFETIWKVLSELPFKSARGGAAREP
jgi:uncharacterized protein